MFLLQCHPDFPVFRQSLQHVIHLFFRDRVIPPRIQISDRDFHFPQRVNRIF